MSNSSARSDLSSSFERVILPPVGPVGQKKTIQYIDDTQKVDKVKLVEWIDIFGNLFGSFELRESITNLHFQLILAIKTLKKKTDFSTEKIGKDINELIVEYTTLAVVCEKLLERMQHLELNFQ